MQPLLLSTGLRYFMVVFEARSLSAAALRLHVAVSAISRQIGKLEDVFGCSLFERHPRGMIPTEAGMRLAAFAHTVSADADRVIEEVQGVAINGSRVVRVSCTEGFSNGFIPEVMASFRAVNPESRINLHVGSPEEVSNMVRNGESDVALKYCVTPETGLVVVHQQSSPVMALVAPSHPLGRRRNVEMQTLLKHPIAMPAEGTTVLRAFDLACSVHGLAYTPAFSGNAASLFNLASSGSAVMLGGYLGAAHLIKTGTLHAIKIDEPRLQDRSLHVLILEGRTLSPMLTRFIVDLVDRVKSVAGPNASTRRNRARKTKVNTIVPQSTRR